MTNTDTLVRLLDDLLDDFTEKRDRLGQLVSLGHGHVSDHRAGKGYAPARAAAIPGLLDELVAQTVAVGDALAELYEVGRLDHDTALSGVSALSGGAGAVAALRRLERDLAA